MLAPGTLGIASRTDSQARVVRVLEAISHPCLAAQVKPTVSIGGPGVGLVEKSVFLVAGALDRHEGPDSASA